MIYENQLGLPRTLCQYKGNLHSHTTNSDGRLTPEEAVTLFKKNGYHFLCLSEHNLYTDYREQLESSDFLLLPGLEASAVLLDEASRRPLRTHHMHGILGSEAMQKDAPHSFSHMEELPPDVHIGSWDGAFVSQRLADLLREYGCLVTYNHPIWSRVEPNEFKDLEGVWALEIYNYDTVNESATGADTTYWDLILRTGRQIYAFASDDNHNPGTFDDACGGWIQVAAPELTHEALLTAMLKGEFYSSNGPQICGWGVEDDRVYIDCSRCERINFICGGCVGDGATVIAPTHDGLLHAEYPLKGSETYVRVECIECSGKTAWTNALFLKKIEG